MNMSKSNSGLQALPLVLITALVGGGLFFALGKFLPRSKGEDVVHGAPVQRGPLSISVIERGNLKAADAVSLKSEIEGQTTILKLLPEGTFVQEGELLCELDATELVDKQFQQEISVRNAEAAFVKSKQNYEIQKSQNDSDVKKAEQSLRFAQIDLEKFREGERRAKEAESDEAIQLAEEERTRAKDKLDWSRKLNEKGFLTDTEMEADRLSLSRAEIQLEQAKRDKDLLIRFQLPRDEADLVAKFEEGQRELERVKLQAAARIVDYEADMRTNEAKLTLEKEKLNKLESQIAKAKLYAPRSGMLVYAQEEGGRWGMENPIKEGTQVRERQEIVTIPSAAGMIAQVSLHESVLKQVHTGMRATIKVDALPGREFQGEVRFVAMMADQNTYWANPNLRLYRTEVTLADASPEMRPGMSCAIEIHVEDIADTLYVPVQSVQRRGEENLAFVEQGGAVQERVVEVGRYNDRWVQVLSGLSEGETVLLAPPAGFAATPEEANSAPIPGAPGLPAAPVADGASPRPEATASAPGGELPAAGAGAPGEARREGGAPSGGGGEGSHGRRGEGGGGGGQGGPRGRRGAESGKGG